MTAITGTAPAYWRMAEGRESRFRLACAWITTVFWFLLVLGTAWDIQWHSDVGPDRFWTAPHTMMYTGVAVGGLVSLYVVLRTTLHYRRGAAGVSDANTTPWLGIFRAPVGFVVSGLGVVGFLLNGGFDEFWHGIYGFDVTIWSPPHVGLIISANFGILGTQWAMAAAVSRARARGAVSLLHPAALGFALAAAVQILMLAVPVAPAFTERTFIGPVSTYPVLAAGFYTLVLAMAASFLRRPGAATLVALLATALRLVVLRFSAAAVNALARAEGLPHKHDAVGITLPVLAVPALLVVAGLVLDLVLWLGERWRRPRRLAVLAAGALAPLLLFTIDRPWLAVAGILPWLARFPAVRDPLLARHAASLPLTMAAVAAAGVLAAWLGWQIGVYQRYTDR